MRVGRMGPGATRCLRSLGRTLANGYRKNGAHGGKGWEAAARGGASTGRRAALALAAAVLAVIALVTSRRGGSPNHRHVSNHGVGVHAGFASRPPRARTLRREAKRHCHGEHETSHVTCSQGHPSTLAEAAGLCQSQERCCSAERRGIGEFEAFEAARSCGICRPSRASILVAPHTM